MKSSAKKPTKALKTVKPAKAAPARRAAPAARPARSAAVTATPATRPENVRHESTPRPSRLNGFWGLGARLWWSVTWRTFVFISLPVLLLQLLIASINNPQVLPGLLGIATIGLVGLPGILGKLITAPEFWFFIAISVYTFIGGIYVYAHLIRHGRAGNLAIQVTSRK